MTSSLRTALIPTALLLAIASTVSTAQTPQLKIKVINAKTNKPITDERLNVALRVDQIGSVAMATDKNGIILVDPATPPPSASSRTCTPTAVHAASSTPTTPSPPSSAPESPPAISAATPDQRPNPANSSSSRSPKPSSRPIPNRPSATCPTPTRTRTERHSCSTRS